MSIKTDQAIEKITNEALALKNNFAIFIEEHLTRICTTDRVAGKLLAGKPLKEFCTSCQKEAIKMAQAQGTGFQIAGLPDQEYLELVEAFYGITAEDKATAAREPAAGDVIDITAFL